MSALAIACRISGVAPPVALPELVTPPQISGVATEAGLFGADQSDTWSYAGTPAVVLARDYRFFLDGALVAGSQAEPTILVPEGGEGLSFAYQMRVSIAGGIVSGWMTLAAGVVQPALRLSQTTDGEVEVDGASGEVTVTITSPAEYAGPHVFQAAGLVSGPINLVPPVIVADGTPAEGAMLSILPGLWIYDPDNGGFGAPSYQWQVDTGGNGVFADVTGATTTSYLLTSGEAGSDVRVIETLADNGGSRVAASVTLSVAALAGGDVASFVMRQVGAETGVGFTTPGLDVSGFSAGDRLVVFHGGATLITMMNIDSNAATIHDTADFGAGNRGVVASYVLQAADITAGTVTIGTDAGGTLNAFAVFHTPSGAVGATDKKQFGTDVDWTIMPTQTENTVIHFAWGDAGAFGGTGFTYVTGPAARLYNDVSGSAGSAAGLVQDGLTAGTTVRWTRDGTGNYASFLVVVE